MKGKRIRPRTKNKMVIGAYQRGAAAYKINLPFTGCPYPSNALYKDAWERGWDEAQRKDKRATAKFRKELEGLKR